MCTQIIYDICKKGINNKVDTEKDIVANCSSHFLKILWVAVSIKFLGNAVFKVSENAPWVMITMDDAMSCMDGRQLKKECSKPSFFLCCFVFLLLSGPGT